MGELDNLLTASPSIFESKLGDKIKFANFNVMADMKASIKRKGLFVVLDGIDGSGKTTVLQHLGSTIGTQGYPIHMTSEPSQGLYGQLLRKRLREKGTPQSYDAHIDSLLFTLDRYDHCQSEIMPMLNQCKVVLCDRYYYSTIAYQSSQGLEVSWLEMLNQYVLTPNVVFILDIMPQTAMERIRDRVIKEKFEKVVFLTKVREAYLAFVTHEQKTHQVTMPDGKIMPVATSLDRIIPTYFIIDASQSIDKIVIEMVTKLHPFLVESDSTNDGFRYS